MLCTQLKVTTSLVKAPASHQHHRYCQQTSEAGGGPGGLWLEPPRGKAGPADFDSTPSLRIMRRSNFYYLKPPRFWYFVMAAV